MNDTLRVFSFYSPKSVCKKYLKFGFPILSVSFRYKKKLEEKKIIIFYRFMFKLQLWMLFRQLAAEEYV